MYVRLCVQLTQLKADLRDVFYSHQWTPDAFLLARAYVAADDEGGGGAREGEGGAREGLGGLREGPTPPVRIPMKHATRKL